MILPAMTIFQVRIVQNNGIITKVGSISLQNLRKNRGMGSISNLGVSHFEGTPSLRKKGHFLKMKNGTTLFTAKSWGQVPPVASSTYIYEKEKLQVQSSSSKSKEIFCLSRKPNLVVKKCFATRRNRQTFCVASKSLLFTFYMCDCCFDVISVELGSFHIKFHYIQMLLE